MKKYICVLATNDYLDGCLILNENLKHIHSKYDLLCLINEDITKETKEILSYFDIKYKHINKINYDVDFEGYVQPYFKNTFDKLSVFKLTEFEKIVYLDLDLLILENIDDLFYYNGLAMARDYPFSNIHNSGVMVIEPNEDDYKGLIELMINKMNNQEQLGDQDIINEYFDRINTLPQSYNLMRRISTEIIDYKPNNWEDSIKTHKVNIHADMDEKKILHYIVTPKPFKINLPFQEKYSNLYSYYMSLIDEKKTNYFKDKEKELN